MIPGGLNPMLMGVPAGIPQDFIAYWPMAGNTEDDTGNYDITLFNGAVQQADHVDFDGGNDYGQCTRLAVSTGFTIVTRVRFDTIDSDGVWIANSRSSITVGEEDQQEWQMVLFPPNGSSVLANAFNTSGSNFSVAGVTAVTTGVWYVAVIRFTGTAIEVGIGGVEASTPFTGTMNTGALNTQFAKRGWGANPSDHGPMDLSRTIVYPYALSDDVLADVVSFIDTGN